MKKLMLIILIISCSKAIDIIDLKKNKDINESLAIAVINDQKDKAIELINQGANINYIYYNKSILEWALNNKNLDVMKELLKKEAYITKNSLVKIYDLALEDFNYDVIDMIKDKYRIEEGPIDKNKYFLFLCYTSNAAKTRKFIENYNINPKEARDRINRNGLIISAFGNKLDILKMLIEEYGLNFNDKKDNGATPLLSACIKNNEKIVELLLEKGANVNDKNRGFTALMHASNYGHAEVVKLLIEKGANINDKDSECVALMKASQNGHLEVVKLLIEKGANINDKNSRCISLIEASQNGHLEVVKLLIEKGANINDKDSECVALMKASQNGHLEVVKLLIEKGADVNAKDLEGWTALMLASRNCSVEVVKLLIEKGANVNDANNRKFAFTYASEKEKIDILELLTEKSANIKSQGCGALVKASENGNIYIMSLLIEKGVDINGRYTEKKVDDNGRYKDNIALISAASNGHLDAVKLLIEKGSDINLKDNNDETAIFHAIKNKHTEIVKLILEKNINVNEKNVKGITLLMQAAISGDKEVVEALLSRGANIDEKDDRGETLLMHASMNGHLEIIKLLLEKGPYININEESKCGYTPFLYSVSSGHLDVMNFLLEKGATYKSQNHSDNVLFSVIFRGYLEVLKFFFNKFEDLIDLDTQDERRDTFLARAIINGDKRIVEFLIEKGANINYKNLRDNETIFSKSLKKENLEILKLLIEKGVNITTLDMNTLIDLIEKNEKLISSLIDKSKVIYIKDQDGKVLLKYLSDKIKNYKEKSKRDRCIEIAYMIIKKMSDDYIQLFISLNKDAKTPQELKDQVNNHINMSYSLQSLPTELFVEIIKKF